MGENLCNFQQLENEEKMFQVEERNLEAYPGRNDWLRRVKSFFCAQPKCHRKNALDLFRVSLDVSAESPFSLKPAHIHNFFFRSFTNKYKRLARCTSDYEHIQRPPRKYQKIMNETRLEFVDFFFSHSLSRQLQSELKRWMRRKKKNQKCLCNSRCY